MGKEYYTESEVMAQFNALTPAKKVTILMRAIQMFEDNRAGSKEYAIASSMNYAYQDDGMYLKY